METSCVLRTEHSREAAHGDRSRGMFRGNKAAVGGSEGAREGAEPLEPRRLGTDWPAPGQERHH